MNCEECEYWNNDLEECGAFECNGFDCPKLPCEEVDQWKDAKRVSIIGD